MARADHKDVPPRWRRLAKLSPWRCKSSVKAFIGDALRTTFQEVPKSPDTKQPIPTSICSVATRLPPNLLQIADFLGLATFWQLEILLPCLATAANASSFCPHEWRHWTDIGRTSITAYFPIQQILEQISYHKRNGEQPLCSVTALIPNAAASVCPQSTNWQLL